MTDSLADQIRAQAAISARPGQLVALEALAAQVAELEHERDVLRQMLRAAAVQLAPAQRPLLGYVVVSRTPHRGRLHTQGSVYPDRGPAEEWRQWLEEQGKPFLVAEVREVQP